MKVECLRPWFGTWPPKLKGGEVNMKPKTLWERWRITTTMLLILLIGLLLLFVCHSFLQKLPELKHVLDSVAVAIIIAGILGLTIDRIFRKQLAEDAFRAAVGYLLPDELKGELEWIYNSRIICMEHSQECELSPIDDETCMIHVHTIRRLRNVSGGVDFVRVGIIVDEWFHKTGSSQIREFGYRKGEKTWPEEGESYVQAKGEDAVIRVAERKIPLAPDEEITIWHRIEEIKRVNDVQSWVFWHPTLNPLVIVKSYAGIHIGVSFGHRVAAQRLGADTYRLNGTLLPSQVITIRWWRVEDLNRWLGEDGNSE